MKVFYDRDADLSALRPKKIAILGFGSQGHAHALNLRDSGMDVRVGLRKDSPSWEKAAKQGLAVFETAEAAHDARDDQDNGKRDNHLCYPAPAEIDLGCQFTVPADLSELPGVEAGSAD